MDMLEAGKGASVGEFDKGQIVMLEDWVRTSPELQLLCGCSWSAVVSTYQSGPRKEQG